MSESITVLVVGRDRAFADELKEAIKKNNWVVLFTDSAQEAFRWCKRYEPDIVLTDLLLSDTEGLELIRQIEGLKSSTSPYKIVMSEYQEEYTEVAAFQNGADGFISKPVRVRALMRRIEAVVRRRGGKNITEIIQVHQGFTIDPNQYLTNRNGKDKVLPKKEFELLYFMAQFPHRIFSREELLENVWDASVLVAPRTVDVHILKIRQKIGADYINTIKGKGYQFIPQPSLNIY